MKVAFKSSFVRDLRSVKDRSLFQRIQTLIENVESAESLAGVPGLKKLRAEGTYYRLRIGQYRVGLSVENETVIFVRVLHRREIYRYFP